MSQPFDPDQLKLSGVARPIASGVHHHVARRFLSLGLTASGRLVYAETPKLPDLHLYWLDRDGAERAARAEPVDTRIIGARVSPDGGRVALSTEDANSFFSLKTLDFGGGALTPVGDPQTFAFGGVWSPDGSELIATLVADGHYYDLARVRAQAGGERRWLHSSPEFETAVGDFTPGGRWFLYGRWSVGDKLGDLMLVDTHGKEPERTYIGGPGDENWPQLSPDGRLAAYVSGASGNLEVWVADFPDARNRRQVSTRFRESEGGRTGQTIRSIGLGWMADDEIYWQDLEGRVTATTILTEGDELAVGPQRPLFGGRALDDREILLDFSIARDRFLLARASGPPPSARLVFVSDWRAGLGRSE